MGFSTCLTLKGVGKTPVVVLKGLQRLISPRGSLQLCVPAISKIVFSNFYWPETKTVFLCCAFIQSSQYLHTHWLLNNLLSGACCCPP